MYPNAMARDTHSVTASKVSENSDTLVMQVPADVQRDLGICIGTMVRVTITDLNGLFDSVGFTNPQHAGDRVTVPAELVRKVGIEPGDEYNVEFDVVEESDETEEATDDDVEESVEEAEKTIDEMLDELLPDDEDEEEEELEEEEEGLGQLFG